MADGLDFKNLITDLATNKEIIKMLCKDSILLFGQIFFGDFKPFDYQEKWIKNLQHNRHLQLSPRDHGKSKIFTEIFPLWAICNVPDVRILIASKSMKQSMKYLYNIKAQLLTNEKLKEVYGDVYLPEDTTGWQARKGRGKWTDNQIYCKRGQGISMRDPTVEAIGVLGAITGSHFDFIICDDVIDDENTKTVKRRNTVLNWFLGTIGQLVEPTTRLFVIGTRKRWDDLYQFILDNPIWHRTVEKAIIKYPNNWQRYIRNPASISFDDLVVKDKNGTIIDIVITGTWKVLAPDLWDIKALLLDRIGSTAPIFEREKQNNPTLMRGHYFDVNWLKYYTELSKSEHFTFYQAADLALSEHEDACWFVDITLAVDRRNNIYVVDYYRTKTKFPNQLNIVKTQAAIHRPIQIGIESGGYQDALKQQLEYETVLPLVAISHGGAQKEQRILTTLAPVFEAGKLYIKESMVELIKEYLGFPKMAHYDILDALEMACSLVLRQFPLLIAGSMVGTSKKKGYEDLGKVDIIKIEKGKRVF